MSFDVILPDACLDELGFTEEHGAARDAARRFLSDRCPMSEVRRLAEDPTGMSTEVHAEMAKLGWFGLVASEDVGGLALDHLHLALLLDEMGRSLLPSPYPFTVLALRAVEGAPDEAQRTRFGCPIAQGEQVATIALVEPGGSFAPDEVRTEARPTEGGYALRGVKTHVPFGMVAESIVVPAIVPGEGVSLFLLEMPVSGVTRSAEVPIDPTRRLARLELDGVVVPREARLAADGHGLLTRVHELGWAVLAAEMAGVFEATLELTRTYAIERVQFGKPIGAFQAVKHPIVDMMLGCEQSRSLAYGALVARDAAQAHAARLSRMAKAYVSDQLSWAVQKAVQLHGGFGFTWDCDAHFFFKRALCDRSTLGDGVHHRRHLAELLLVPRG